VLATGPESWFKNFPEFSLIRVIYSNVQYILSLIFKVSSSFIWKMLFFSKDIFFQIGGVSGEQPGF